MFKYIVLISLLFASSAYAERTLKTWGNLFAEDTCHEQSKVLKFSQGSCYKHATTGKMMRKVCMEHCSLLNLFDYACALSPKGSVINHWAPNHHICQDYEANSTAIFHVKDGSTNGCGYASISNSASCSPSGPWTSSSYCGASHFEYKECEWKVPVQPCAPPSVDCVVGHWSNFTKCIGGKQTRTRQILVHPAFGGASCPPLVEEKECKLFFPETGCGLELQISQCRLDLTKTSTVCTIPGTNFTITVPTQDVHGFNRFRIRLLVRGEYKV